MLTKQATMTLLNWAEQSWVSQQLKDEVATRLQKELQSGAKVDREKMLSLLEEERMKPTAWQRLQKNRGF